MDIVNDQTVVSGTPSVQVPVVKTKDYAVLRYVIIAALVVAVIVALILL